MMVETRQWPVDERVKLVSVQPCRVAHCGGTLMLDRFQGTVMEPCCILCGDRPGRAALKSGQ
jgi:hypothetical protein